MNDRQIWRLQSKKKTEREKKIEVIILSVANSTFFFRPKETHIKCVRLQIPQIMYIFLIRQLGGKKLTVHLIVSLSDETQCDITSFDEILFFY